MAENASKRGLNIHLLKMTRWQPCTSIAEKQMPVFFASHVKAQDTLSDLEESALRSGETKKQSDPNGTT